MLSNSRASTHVGYNYYVSVYKHIITTPQNENKLFSHDDTEHSFFYAGKGQCMHQNKNRMSATSMIQKS